MSRKLSPKRLEKMKVPKVLIAGLVMASVLGWAGWGKLKDIQNYYQIRKIFPLKTYSTGILDGDTFVIKNGLTVRLLGINAPDRGKEKYDESTNYLNHLIMDKPLSLEYDQYQDDKYGRILAYVWIGCLPEIIQYCRDNKTLVNEVMLKQGFSVKVVYEDRKKLKYDSYLQTN